MAQGKGDTEWLRHGLQLLLMLWSLEERQDTGLDHIPSSSPVISQTSRLCELLGLACCLGISTLICNS